MREIRLYGHLGREFGRVHHLAVESVGEAIRALRANYPRFEAALIEHAPGFRVWCGRDRLADVEDVHDPVGRAEVIRLAPVVAGSGKSGLGQVLFGAALVGAALLMPAGAFGFGSSVLFGSTTVASLTGSIGISLALGGIAQMLSPQPDVQAGGQEGQTAPSYVFNGAQNTTAQGNPVPVGYGRLVIGSAVISAGIATTDIALT